MRPTPDHQMMLWGMSDKVWEKLPLETRSQCRKLMANLLVKTVLEESRERRKWDEREDQTDPS